MRTPAPSRMPSRVPLQDAEQGALAVADGNYCEPVAPLAIPCEAGERLRIQRQFRGPLRRIGKLDALVELRQFRGVVKGAHILRSNG